MSMKSTRTEKIEVSLTPEEKRKIKNIADQRGQKMSAYGRTQMLAPLQAAVIE